MKKPLARSVAISLLLLTAMPPAARAVCTLNIEPQKVSADTCPGVSASASAAAVDLLRDTLDRIYYSSEVQGSGDHCVKMADLMQAVCRTSRKISAVFIPAGSDTPQRVAEIAKSTDPRLAAQPANIATLSWQSIPQATKSDLSCRQVGKFSLHLSPNCGIAIRCKENFGSDASLQPQVTWQKFYGDCREWGETFAFDRLYAQITSGGTRTEPSTPFCDSNSLSCVKYNIPLLTQGSSDLMKIVTRKTRIAHPQDVGFCAPTTNAMLMAGLKNQSGATFGDSVDASGGYTDPIDGSSAGNWSGAIFRSGQLMGTDWWVGGTYTTQTSTMLKGGFGDAVGTLASFTPGVTADTDLYTNANMISFMNKWGGMVQMPLALDSTNNMSAAYHSLLIAGHSGGHLRVMDPWGRAYLVDLTHQSRDAVFIELQAALFKEPSRLITKSEGQFRRYYLYGYEWDIPTSAKEGQRYPAWFFAQAGQSRVLEGLQRYGLIKLIHSTGTSVPTVKHISGEQGFVYFAPSQQAQLVPRTEAAVVNPGPGVYFDAAESQNVLDVLYGYGQRIRPVSKVVNGREPTDAEYAAAIKHVQDSGGWLDRLTVARAYSDATGEKKVSGTCGTFTQSRYTLDQAETSELTEVSYCASGVKTSFVYNASEMKWTWTCKGSGGGTNATCSALQMVAGECGSAHTGFASSLPAQNLCARGAASAVTLEPSGLRYEWSCSGANGGLATGCMAPAIKDGLCGSAVLDVDKAPSVGLCHLGTASGVAENTSGFSWSCSGLSGGSSVMCSVPAPALGRGACGTAINIEGLSAPAQGLCASGAASSVTIGVGLKNAAFEWTCRGTEASATCRSVRLMPGPGACGPAHGLLTSTMPVGGLCTKGTSGKASEDSSSFTWVCSGVAGGAAVSCRAPKGANSVCGPANGVAVANAPSNGLCSSGVASAAALWSDKFTWFCQDQNAKILAFCSAPRAKSSLCGPSNNARVESAPSSGLCAGGTPSAVKALGYGFSWTCTDPGSGSSAQCLATLAPPGQGNDGACGSAHSVATATAPTGNLCARGQASAVGFKDPYFTWSCSGQSGGASVNCSAVKKVNGACGPANGVAAVSLPREKLCSAGSPQSVITHAKSYAWTCTGWSGGASISCWAPRSSSVKCGLAAGGYHAAAPTSNLCLGSGTPTAVITSGPQYQWSCVDAALGLQADCVAEVSGYGLCGAAHRRDTPTVPVADLCRQGTPSAVTKHKISVNTLFKWTCALPGAPASERTACWADLNLHPTPVPGSEVVGRCGAASGRKTQSAPKQELCVSGTASAVQFANPYFQWSCQGANGGASANCLAQKSADGVCGAASGSATEKEPTAHLCANGRATGMILNGPYYRWLCAGGIGGVSADCSARKVVNGACGSASGVATARAPAKNTCAKGLPSAVSQDGKRYRWTCGGIDGGKTVECSAPSK